MSAIATAQAIHEPPTTLRIIAPDSAKGESSPTPARREVRDTSLVIRDVSVRPTKTVVPARAPLADKLPEEPLKQTEVSGRVRLDVSADQPWSSAAKRPSMSPMHAAAGVEERLPPLSAPTNITRGPAGDQVYFNRLRSEPSDTLRPSETSLAHRPANFNPRPNVLRMGDEDTAADAVRVVSYLDRPKDTPANEEEIALPAEQPRQQTFAALPMTDPAKRLGPFEVTDRLESLNIVERCAKVLRTTREVTRTETADPNVCTVAQFMPGELSIVAKQPGRTKVTFWFEGLAGESISYEIIVLPNPLRR